MDILDTYGSIRNRFCLLTDVFIAVGLFYLVYPQWKERTTNQTFAGLNENFTALKQEVDIKFSILENDTMPKMIQGIKEHVLNEKFEKVFRNLSSVEGNTDDGSHYVNSQPREDVNKALQYIDEAEKAFQKLKQDVNAKYDIMKEEVRGLNQKLVRFQDQFEGLNQEIQDFKMEIQTKLELRIKDKVAEIKAEFHDQITKLKGSVDDVRTREALFKYDVDIVWILLILVIAIILAILIVMMRR